MTCPLCQQRKAKRQCPALSQAICPTCCATKRVTEIACPETCGYLAAGRDHPAATVRRQQERDVSALLPSMQGLTERQQQLYFLFLSVVVTPAPDDLTTPADDDVAEAAGAAAATLETAARGLIYEHSPQSVPAQRLTTGFLTLLARVRQDGTTVYDREAAVVLRSMERGARETRTRVEGGDAATAYLTLIRRLLMARPQAGSQAKPRAGSPVEPGDGGVKPGSGSLIRP
jgi:hypothetical protein